MKYRKKPIVIEAEQFHFGRKPPEGVVEPPLQERGREPRSAWMDTLEGGHIVSDGDWIITGIKGERYPCKPDIFEATYDAVVDESAVEFVYKEENVTSAAERIIREITAMTGVDVPERQRVVMEANLRSWRDAGADAERRKTEANTTDNARRRWLDEHPGDVCAADVRFKYAVRSAERRTLSKIDRQLKLIEVAGRMLFLDRGGKPGDWGHMLDSEKKPWLEKARVLVESEQEETVSIDLDALESLDEDDASLEKSSPTSGLREAVVIAGAVRAAAEHVLSTAWDLHGDMTEAAAESSSASDYMSAMEGLRAALNSKPPVTQPMPTPAVKLIAEERRNQIIKGYIEQHDDGHERGELAIIGAALAVHHTDASVEDPHEFVEGHNKDMWGLIREHGHDTVRSLTIAGALIAAELDRILRQKGERWAMSIEGLGRERIGGPERPTAKLREMATDFMANWMMLPPLVRASSAVNVWKELERTIRHFADTAAREKISGMERRSRVTALIGIADGHISDFMAALANHADGEAEKANIDADVRYRIDEAFDPLVALAYRQKKRDPNKPRHPQLDKTWKTAVAKDTEEFIAKASATIESEVDAEVMEDLKTAGWKEGDLMRVPHYKATAQAIAKLRDMPVEEAFQTFIKTGILTEDGKLTPEYGGKP